MIGIIVALIVASAVYCFSNKFASAASSAASEAESSIFRTLAKLIRYAYIGGRCAARAIKLTFGGVYVMATKFSSVVSETMHIFKSKLNWAEWGIFMGMVVGENIAMILSGGSGLEARIASSIACVVSDALIIGGKDYTDSDGTPTKTVLEVIGSIF